MTRRLSTHRDRGFVLIEAIVALTILLAVLGLFYRGWRAVADQTIRADMAAGALMIARERLEAAGVETSLKSESSFGSQGDYQWALEVLDRPTASGPQLTERSLRSYTVRVEVSWRGGGSQAGGNVRLATVKLSRRP